MKGIEILEATRVAEYLNQVLVYSHRLEKHLLIKAFPKGLSEGTCNRIAQDLERLESISHYHFNNVQLLHSVPFSDDFVESYGVPISAEDYFEGEDFNHWKDHLKGTPEGILEILRYCKDLACILDEIHSVGMKHCFVDLESILICQEKGLRLTHVTNRIYERYLDTSLKYFETERDALMCERDYFAQIIQYFLDEFLVEPSEELKYGNKADLLLKKFKKEEQSFSQFMGNLLSLFGHDYLLHRNKSAKALKDFLVENQIEHGDLTLCSHSVAELARDMNSTLSDTLSGLENFGVLGKLEGEEVHFTISEKIKTADSNVGVKKAGGAGYPSIEHLAEGSAEAQEAQRAYVERSGLPLEVVLPKSGIQLRLIPAGTVEMGSPKGELGRGDNELQYKSVISSSFYIAKYPITQKQWRTVMGATLEKSPIARFMKKSNLMNNVLDTDPSEFKDSGDDAPVESVTWFDAEKFLKRLCDFEDLERGCFTLPTEGQWEYACRAGTSTRFYSGDSEEDLDKVAWYANPRSPALRTQPVGKKLPNAFGLYDMHGNVWEWCYDWYGVYAIDEVEKYKGESLLESGGFDYTEGAVKDYKGPKNGQHKMTKGGSWTINDHGCRSADRSKGSPTNRSAFLGFRITMKLDKKNKI